jgi:small subunit ribosomal protein S19
MAEQKTETQEVMRTKEILYRGKSIDFLKGLDVRESAKYLPSRSRRSIMRNFDVIEKFIKRCDKKLARNKRIRTHLRDLIIVPKLVGMTIGIYNGRQYNDMLITIEMIGHRLGEFSQTRGIVKHGSAGIGSTKGSKAAKK